MKHSALIIGSMLVLIAVPILTGIPRTEAQAPNFINYQSRLRDSNLDPVDTATTIQFSLYNHASNGDPGDTPDIAGPLIWTEIYDDSMAGCERITPDTLGYFTVRLGSCTGFPAYLDFTTTELYLGVKIESDDEATPRARLASTPFAINALRVGMLEDTGSNTLTVRETGIATLLSQGENSATFVLQGSGWDSNLSQAVERAMKFQNVVSDSDNYVFTIYNDNDEPILEINQDGILTVTGYGQRVRNMSGSTISAMTVVKLTGLNNGLPTISAVISTTDAPLGILLHAVDDGENGTAMTSGLLKNALDTSGAAVGDSVYFDGSGALDLAYTGSANMGTVIRVDNPGDVQVNIQPAIMHFASLTADEASFDSLSVGTPNPVASALLELSSIEKGFLMPRMTTVQRDAIASPATGLQIYNITTNTPQIYNGTQWVEIGGSLTSVQVTSSLYDGDLSFSGLVGYQAANAICNDEFPGSYFCQTSDIINVIARQDIGPGGLDFDSMEDAWIAEGPPGYTAAANDCRGWKTNSNAELGPFWIFSASGGGDGWLVNCQQTKRLACCM